MDFDIEQMHSGHVRVIADRKKSRPPEYLSGMGSLDRRAQHKEPFNQHEPFSKQGLRGERDC
jgi:hypothetical protein